MVSVSRIGRIKQVIVFGAMALSLLAAGNAPLLGGESVEAAKHKKGRPDIAIQDIAFSSGPNAGHRTVTVAVANVGKRAAAGFTIALVAEQPDGDVRPTEYSVPLRLGKGQSTAVEFVLGCGWLHNGTVTASTDPSPVPNEKATKAANNTLSEGHGICLIPLDL
jgi:hypothetical protein